MSHFLHRSKVSSPAVAGEVSTPHQRYENTASQAMRAQQGMLKRNQAQLHQPRPRILKPPIA